LLREPTIAQQEARKMVEPKKRTKREPTELQWKGFAPPRTLPLESVPKLMALLRRNLTLEARALEFAILTGATIRDVLAAKCGQIDHVHKLWVIPPSGDLVNGAWDEISESRAFWFEPEVRARALRPHRIPLGISAQRLVASVCAGRAPDEWMFVEGSGPPTTIKQFKRRLYRIKPDSDQSARLSLKAWLDENDYVGALREAVFHPTLPRGGASSDLFEDFLEQRREVMERWGQFVSGNSDA